jgi:hypothetical protein
MAAALEKEKQADIAGELASLREQKAKRRAALEQEISGLKKSLETAEGEEAEYIRKELQKRSDKLGSLDAAYQSREDDLVRLHEQKLVSLERIRREMEEWEAAFRAARGK